MLGEHPQIIIDDILVGIARKLLLVDGRIEVVFIIDSRSYAHLHGSLFQEFNTDVELHL